MPLAIFDFDGTIYQGETLRLFLRVLGRDERKRPAVKRYFILHAPGYLCYRLGLWRLRMMTLAMKGLCGMLKGMSGEELDAYFHRCLVEAKPGFNPALLNRLEAHLAAGDRTVLLSGAFSRFLALVAKELGISHWLGTELETDRCSGEMGKHCIGQAKLEALQVFLHNQEKVEAGFNLSDAYAYTDGLRDLSLLSLVDHPVAVNPDKGLRKEAQKRGWEII